ncbi:MAG: response regulator [Pseudobutyrivibrio ruminis]|nr:response regulator [Pseudobutyrivibrio ruminis]
MCMDSKLRDNRIIMSLLILGGVIVAGVLIIGMLLTGRKASEDTNAAVRNVSLLYLDELAGRREQVVESVLNDYTMNIDIALGLLEKSDLSSTDSFQSYQARMKQLYGFEKFAFVDTNGLIYTSRGRRTDIDTYAFDYNNLSEPEISLKNVDGKNKKVIIAVPVDRIEFENNVLVACFVEIDMDTLLSSISLQSNNNTTFCNLYTADGVSLADTVLGGLASENNLLTAMTNATFEDGYSLEEMRQNFSQGKKGVVSFTYNGIRETLYYVPVTGTNWMLTYLIRESIISEQITSISDGIVLRSFILSVFAAFLLIIIFIFIVIQTKRAAKITLEKEVSETENRVRQEELEEQLALQEELLEQEKHRTQQNSMITALASDYRSVYYIDLDADEGICYQSDSKIKDNIEKGSHFHFASTFNEYAMDYVDEEFRNDFLDFINLKNIQERLSKESIISFRYLIVRDGRKSYEMLRIAGVKHPEDREDQKIHAIGIGFSDIDEKMRDSLAKNQALSDALKAAEEASKAKTVFLSNMSHEIRTPMNAIIGLGTLALKEDDISETTRDYLEKIDGSAQHLLSLINDILDMSRIESGKVTLKNEEFSFSKLINQINTMFNGQCNDKGLEYVCKMKSDLDDHYIGDDIKLKQVLINILGNAVKFTPAGGRIDFTVEKIGVFDGKTTLRFVITDTGVGISKEYLPRLFDSFSQEDSTIVNKYGSSGLGMAITKSIVDMMNGKIEVISEKGKGTTFTVIITLVNAEPKGEAIDGEDNAELASKKSVSEDVNSKFKGKRILIAEDVEINAQILTKILKMKQIDVEHAINGKVALDMFSSHSPGYYDAILMDMRMPEMDGIEATEKIRTMNRDDSKTIPIIALTANAFDEDVQHSLQAGMNAHLSKPIDTKLLFETLDNCLIQI